MFINYSLQNTANNQILHQIILAKGEVNKRMKQIAKPYGGTSKSGEFFGLYQMLKELKKLNLLSKIAYWVMDEDGACHKLMASSPDVPKSLIVVCDPGK